VTVTSDVVGMFLTGGRVDLFLLRVLRVFRVARSLRVFRALHGVRPLRQLMDNIVSSFSGLVWCFVLIFFITSVFATFLVQCVVSYWENRTSSGDNPPAKDQANLVEAFGSVPAAMLSLFKCTSGGDDWGGYFQLLLPTGQAGPAILVAYILFFLIAAWNIITSLFLESAMTLALPDTEEQMLNKRRKEKEDANYLLSLVEAKDADCSGTISLQEFKTLLSDRTVQSFFSLKDLDIKDPELFFSLMQSAAKSGEVPMDMLATSLMRMCGSATNIDLQTLNIQVLGLFADYENSIKGLRADLGDIMQEVRSLSRSANVELRQNSAAIVAVQSEIESISMLPMSKV